MSAPPGRNLLVAGVVASIALVAIIVLLLLIGQTTPGSGQREGLWLEPLATIEGPGSGVTPGFSRPLGVAVADDGTIYVADSGNNRICVFSQHGEFLREWGGFGIAKPLPGGESTWTPGLLNYPTGVDVGEDGLVYVADFHNDSVSVFSPEGSFLRVFPDPRLVTGRGGSGKEGQGVAATDVSQHSGFVAVTDTYQVFLFTTQGGFVRQFGRPGSGLTDIDHPNGVQLLDDSIILSDSNHLRVVAYDLMGEAKWWAGANSSASASATAEFGLPRGLCVLDDGSILVADAVNHSLRLLGASGDTIASIGGRGTAPGQFNFPTDVDALDDVVVVADKENNRVQVLRLHGIDRRTGS